MDLYKQEIKSIFNNKPDPKNQRPGIRWAFEPIKYKTQYLILGIKKALHLCKAFAPPLGELI